MVIDWTVTGQVPVFVTGNGSDDWHAPTLWMTVAGNAWFPVTVSSGAGVVAVSGMYTAGSSGSLLATLRRHECVPSDCGVYWMVKGTHCPPPTDPANGLLTIVKCGQAASLACSTTVALLTLREHDPVLQTSTVRSPAAVEHTLPKAPLPVRLMSGAPDEPVRFTVVVGNAGSLLAMLSVALTVPGALGRRSPATSGSCRRRCPSDTQGPASPLCSANCSR